MDLLEIATKNREYSDHLYVPGHSIAGFFPSTKGRGSFYSVHPHDNEWRGNIFLPKICKKILGSSMGIVLCYPYKVLNPLLKGSDVKIPMPATTLADPNDPHALVAYVDEKLGPVFYIVCAFSAGHHQYEFNVWSSYTIEWRTDQIRENLGDIMVNTGTSCGRRAYWLTKRPLLAVVYYDVSDSSLGFLDVPEKFQVDPCPYQLQLGSWKRNQLILLVSMASEMEVYTFSHEQKQWELSFHQEFRDRRPPIPMRSQSVMQQAVFCVDNWMLIWEKRCNEKDKMQQSQPPCMSLKLFEEIQQDAIADFVPYIENTLRPHDFNPTGRRLAFSSD